MNTPSSSDPSNQDKNQEIILHTRPHGKPVEDNWRVVDCPYPVIKEGELLLAARYVSVDPYLRGRVREHKIGEVMVSGVVAEVLDAKNCNKFKTGDFVQGYLPWRRFTTSDEKSGLRKVDPSVAPISTALGVLGMPGMTAYFGLLDTCACKPTDTVLVSGAAGAVGLLVGQIAKILGCRVIGTAGGADKCKLLKEEFAFDAALDYKKYTTIDSMREALSQAAPNGIDVYFDNTGGVVTDAVFDLMNKYGRVAICGQISMYNASESTVGPLFLHKLIYKSITIKGFVVMDFVDRAAQFHKDMSTWLKEGKVQYRETISDGFDKLPQAFIGLFDGVNTGKAVVKV